MLLKTWVWNLLNLARWAILYSSLTRQHDISRSARFNSIVRITLALSVLMLSLFSGLVYVSLALDQPARDQLEHRHNCMWSMRNKNGVGQPGRASAAHFVAPLVGEACNHSAAMRHIVEELPHAERDIDGVREPFENRELIYLSARRLDSL